MSEYEHTTIVNSNPKQVFGFVSAAGQQYDSHGYYHVDNSRMRLEWGSDGENQCRGWLEVRGNEGGTTATVLVHLSLEPRSDIAEEYERQNGSRHGTIQKGLKKALQSIKNICEGRRGKVESRAA